MNPPQQYLFFTSSFVSFALQCNPVNLRQFGAETKTLPNVGSHTCTCWITTQYKGEKKTSIRQRTLKNILPLPGVKSNLISFNSFLAFLLQFKRFKSLFNQDIMIISNRETTDVGINGTGEHFSPRQHLFFSWLERTNSPKAI